MAKIFGILNITPDSFSDGGKYETSSDALRHAQELFGAGAAYIDIGAESTNPHSRILSPEEEQVRLKPVLPQLLDMYPKRISLDTYHPETVLWSLKYGRPIINDVSGVSDEMAGIVAQHGLRIITGHLPKEANGVPIKAHDFKIDSLQQIVEETEANIFRLNQMGIHPSKLIIDPGIGFGKSMRLNWELLTFANYFPTHQVMIGASLKRFLGCHPITGELLADQELRYTNERNLEAAEIAVRHHATYLRVHDPKIYSKLLK